MNTHVSEFVSDHESFPTLFVLQKEYGFKFVFDLVVAMLLDLTQSLNVPQMAEEQIYEIARELINDNPSFKPEDFQLFFQNMKKGIYGQFYNRIDIQVIYLALKQYSEHREQIFEDNLNNRKNILNSAPPIRIENPKDVQQVNTVMKEVYEKAIQKAEQEKAREKYIAENKEQWTQEAIAEWGLNKKLYYEQNPDANELYYDYNFPKSDFVKWWLKKKG